MSDLTPALGPDPGFGPRLCHSRDMWCRSIVTPCQCSFTFRGIPNASDDDSSGHPYLGLASGPICATIECMLHGPHRLAHFTAEA
jgi:hypothetical protein